LFALAKGFDDEGEVEEAEEEDIEFLEAREDSAEAFESPEKPLDFVALLVESEVVFPGLDAVGLWRTTGIMPKLSTSCLVASPS
jgi:hypothetical protein